MANAWYLDRLVSSASQRLEQAGALAQTGDWQRARDLTREACEDWEHHGLYFHTVLRHSDIDAIRVAFRMLDAYLELEEMDQYAAANAQLLEQLSLLIETERPTLENVL